MCCVLVGTVHRSLRHNFSKVRDLTIVLTTLTGWHLPCVYIRRQTSPDGHRDKEPIRTTYRPQRFAGPRGPTAWRVTTDHLQPHSRQPLEDRAHRWWFAACACRL